MADTESEHSDSISEQTGSESQSEPAPPVAPSPEVLAAGLSQLSKTTTLDGYAYVNLNLKNRGIETLEGLEKFVHVRYLDASKNEGLKDASAAGDLPCLVSANFSECGLERVPVASSGDGLDYLQVLDLTSNALVSLSSESEGEEGSFPHPSVTKLSLTGNKITSIQPLSGHAKLATLEVRQNALKNLDLTECSRLKAVWAAENQLEFLDGLDKCPLLESLHVRDNGLTTFQGMGKDLPALKSINARDNQISDVKQLAGLADYPALEKLCLAGNPIEEDENYRSLILTVLPKLKTIDKDEVSAEELEDAVELKAELEAEEAARVAAEAAAAEAAAKEASETDTLGDEEEEDEEEDEESAEGDDDEDASASGESQ